MSKILKNIPNSILRTEAKQVTDIHKSKLKLVTYLIQSVDSPDSRLTVVALDLLFKLIEDSSHVIIDHISSILDILCKRLTYDNGLNPLVTCCF